MPMERTIIASNMQICRTRQNGIDLFCRRGTIRRVFKGRIARGVNLINGKGVSTCLLTT